MTKTLDLGCGDVPRNPFHADALFGVDVRSNLAGNIRSADLTVEPIPFDDDSFDYLTAYDFIEHIPRVVYAPHRRNAFIEVMNEVHRVLKPGGLFLSHTPAYPHPVAFRDPTHVNIITDETLPMYFDDQNRWASIYGFKGAFKVLRHEWRGPHIVAVMQKVASPDRPAPAPPDNPRISVFVPVYNGETYIAATLESLLAQSHADFEVLCIDDASTDGSPQILRSFAARDPRIRVITTPQNLGSAPKALNHALPQMTGGRFVYASQDDLFSPDWLARMHARAVETGAQAVIPDVVMFHEGQPSLDRTLSGVKGDRSRILTGREACTLSLDWTIPGNALWDAALVRRIGIEDFALNADEYTARRLFLACDKVAFSGGQFRYRQDNPNAITKRQDAVAFEWPTTRLRVAQLLQENGFDVALVRKEIDDAVSAMDGLRRRFDASRAAWSEDELAKARAAIARFDARLALPQVFGQPVQPSSKAQRRLAKWQNSLRKLPKKLGLAR
jgi:glycosyltransferase involved in cell wall biosynthesis